MKDNKTNIKLGCEKSGKMPINKTVFTISIMTILMLTAVTTGVYAYFVHK